VLLVLAGVVQACQVAELRQAVEVDSETCHSVAADLKAADHLVDCWECPAADL